MPSSEVASAVGKPDGLLEVPPGTELQFLHPLPVRRLWGVGPKTEARLHEVGIATVGQIAELGEHRLAAFLGRGSARHLYALSMAHDPRRVDTGRRRKSIGAQRALGRRVKSAAEIEAEKATQELESPATGTLTEIVVAEGQDAQVRTIIAWIETDA